MPEVWEKDGECPMMRDFLEWLTLVIAMSLVYVATVYAIA